MLNSQALETGIGLALMMFVFAVVASNVLDLGRRLLNLRSKDLEVALMSMFDEQPDPWLKRAGKALSRLFGAVGGPELEPGEQTAWDHFKQSSVYRGAAAARQQVRPAYLSAKAFAEAVQEIQEAVPLTGPLAERLKVVRKDAAEDLTKVRAELEGWFDEAMAGLSGRYQKKSTVWLFVIGVALAWALNASFPHVARDLWQDGVTRAAVVAAAENYSAPTPSATPTSLNQSLEEVAGATENITALSLPIGWSRAPAPNARGGDWWLLHGLGWLMTGALAALGGPFWFDIFGRLTAARSGKPPQAKDDETSATRAVAQSLANPAPAAQVDPSIPAVVELSLGLGRKARTQR